MNPALLALPAALLGAYGFWRYVWFFRNPPRCIPQGDHFVSPADGRVVYVRLVNSREEVILIKRGLAATLEDIIREDLDRPKVHIGIFMSPFDVHYNRVPLPSRVEALQHHPPRPRNHSMARMHWRTLLKRPPFQKHSLHLMTNERLVTRFTGDFRNTSVSYYVVQIAGRRVRGISSFCQVGDRLARGAIFGLIRIGSQVDLVAPYFPDMVILVRPGDKVRAGESILIR